MDCSAAGEGIGMSLLHVIGAVVAFGLLVYLCVALLRPEIFE